MKRSTLLVVLVVTSLVVTTGAVGAAAAPLASGDAAATVIQEGDGNATVTPTPTTPVANDSANGTNATAESGTTNATDTTSEPPTFGAVVSSFMQTSAADAENEVEDGIFEAKFDRSNASERARLVRQRATQLGDRIAELREERTALLDSENVTVRERAQAARLAAQSDGLTESISQTENAAQRADVALDRTALDELRTEARNLTGPEVADLARGLVDKERPPRGPPSDRGPDRDGSNPVGVENATDTNETEVVDSQNPGRSGDAGRPTDTATASSDDGQSSQADDGTNSSERKPGADQRNPRSDGANDSTSDTPTATATPTADGGDGTGTDSAQ